MNEHARLYEEFERIERRRVIARWAAVIVLYAVLMGLGAAIWLM